MNVFFLQLVAATVVVAVVIVDHRQIDTVATSHVVTVAVTVTVVAAADVIVMDAAPVVAQCGVVMSELC
jgi:hypothetical protein